MRQDQRAAFVEALEQARLAAYPPGEFAGQESFMLASEILDLARAAGIGPGVSVLDLCCGTAGPGRLITAEFGCDYLGVDSSAEAVELARQRTHGLPCRFEVAQIPPLPSVHVDVVLLLETALAFPDKAELLRAVAGVLPPGGRFALTVEEGAPLTPAERRAMPDADTVWLVPLAELIETLADAGLRPVRQWECTTAHRRMAESLLQSMSAQAAPIEAAIGRRALDDLLEAHRYWSEWMRTGRLRKIALVAESKPQTIG